MDRICVGVNVGFGKERKGVGNGVCRVDWGWWSGRWGRGGWWNGGGYFLVRG